MNNGVVWFQLVGAFDGIVVGGFRHALAVNRLCVKSTKSSSEFAFAIACTLKRRINAMEEWIANGTLLKADANTQCAAVIEIDLGLPERYGRRQYPVRSRRRLVALEALLLSRLLG